MFLKFVINGAKAETMHGFGFLAVQQ